MGEEAIATIVNRAASGEYDIPEFQREFVWRSDQVWTLCDSLYHDCPIGAMLLWDVREYQQPQVGQLAGRQPLWIVDGQQRIASLCLLFGRKPHWWDHDEWTDLYEKHRVYLNVPLDSEGGITFGRPQRRDGWLSIGVDDILKQRDSEGAVAVAREHAKGQRPEVFERLVGHVVAVWNLREHKVLLVTMGEEKPPELVAEIYRRVNMMGTRVRQTDIKLAYIAVHNRGWVREEFYPFMQQLEDDKWDIDPGHMLQVIMAFKKGRVRVREVEDEFWRKELIEVWPQVKDAVQDALLRLWDCGITDLDLVPSDYTLIPFFALHARFGDTPEYSFDALVRWFVLANMAGRYGDAPLETLSKDARVLHDTPSFGAALSHIRPSNYSKKELRTSLQSPFKKGSTQALLLHVLLWQRDARDWFEKLSIRALTKAPRKLELHWHHILPKAWAKRNGYDGAEQAANVTLVCAQTNVKAFASRPPWEYAKDRIPIDSLQDHFVPERFAAAFYTGKGLNSRDFRKFLVERTDLLVQAGAEYLGLEDGMPGEE
jgi:hypothetical protein